MIYVYNCNKSSGYLEANAPNFALWGWLAFEWPGLNFIQQALKLASKL